MSQGPPASVDAYDLRPRSHRRHLRQCCPDLLYIRPTLRDARPASGRTERCASTAGTLPASGGTHIEVVGSESQVSRLLDEIDSWAFFEGLVRLTGQ